MQERLAVIFDAAHAIGWWDWDIPTDRFHAGRKCADLLGIDSEQAAEGVSFSRFIDGIDKRDRAHVDAAIRHAVDVGGPFSEEFRIADVPNGFRPRWVAVNGHCYRGEDGKPRRFPGVLLDITDRRLTELRKQALLQLGDRLRELTDIESIAYAAATSMAEVLTPSRAGFGIVDEGSETVFIPPEWRRSGTSSISGQHNFREYGSFIDDLKAGQVVAIDDVEHDPRTAMHADALLGLGIRALINIPILEHGKFVLVVLIHSDGPVDWSERDLRFSYAVADRVQAALGRLRAEQQRELLNRELSHRLKNSLSMAQSIVSQSLRSARDLESAKAGIGRRLSALGHAHEVLLKGSVEQAGIIDVVTNALRPHQDEPMRISWKGPDIALAAGAALSLSLIIHELATNAAKHGSLSVEEGRVDLEWRVTGENEDRLTMRWTERNGPTVIEPSRSGFGSRLIRYGVTGATDQTVEIDYRPEGLVWHLDALLSGISVPHPAETPPLPASS
ncbi:sensor histidine kinase [Notoacmeibacter ruber]|nr:HWE histidine kinase domain-containing protein [Notoacmeibacter ruber]